jgi:uncharacterized protein YfaS (alpha-2-macroglobulin family)
MQVYAMTTRAQRCTTALSFLLLILIILLPLVSGVFARAANSPDTVSPDDLGGEDRTLAYLSTDKPIYRSGETVYLRTVFLNALDNTPLDDGRHTIDVKISGPKGDVVHEGKSYGNDSAIGYQWTVPEGISGGQYTATVTSPDLGTTDTTREFEIRAFRAPRIKSQIQFTRDGYGPADQVRANISIERAEGGVPQGATITAIARLDGNEIYRSPSLPLAGTGIADAVFTLPEQIETGDGSLAFVIEDGGVVETASKSLPILLNKIDVEFYPESGDLVSGLQNRVYFQALLNNGKPADVHGYIVEVVGNEPGTDAIVEFKSTHEGRGKFFFTPKQGKKYAAVFTNPSGIAAPSVLPTVINSGTVITSNSEVYHYSDGIEISVSSNDSRSPARITLYKREVMLDSKALSVNDNTNASTTSNTTAGTTVTVQLDPEDAEGVLMVTAWDEAGHPLAERLIYRKPRYGINVELKTSDGPYVPGDEVSVDIVTTDTNGDPVEAVVGLTVTDDAVLELIENREQAPRLPVMVYLENEVLDLADAHVYLDPENPVANSAIDLLLGTQGWRRFVLTNFKNLARQHPDDTARVMGQIKPRPVFRRDGLQVRAMARGAAANIVMMAAEENVEAMADAAVLENIALPAAAPLPEEIPAPEIMRQDIDDERAVPEPAKPADLAKMIVADQGLAVNAEIAADVLPRVANIGYIREFAYQARPNRKPNDRVDFTETLYWNSGIKTSARNGKASVKFSMSDSVTTFRVLADAYGRNGALGARETIIASVEPFYVTSKMPLHAVASDIIQLPVTLVNTTSKPLANATLRISGEGIESASTATVTLAPGARERRIIRVTTAAAGTFPITISAQAGPYSDTVTRTLSVKPAGFPISVSKGGLLSSTNTFSTTVNIPDAISPGSMAATARVYPSPLASMQEALNALLREPHGCFEQTSSTNYPLVMAQQYFDSHVGIDPSVIARSQSLLKTGYGKLISFESEGNGYEWFGANPAHEALTAYGLMEFTDMAKVMNIDTAMIDRTRQWLLDRRDGNGGFKRNEKALDSFGRAPAPTTDAYIVWSLLESGQSPQSLAREIEQVKASAMTGSDSYIDALAANILFLSGDTISAEVLLKKLATAAKDTGAVGGSVTSITGSGGDSLTIETTSLALLAWLRNDEQWAAQVEQSINWLFERSKSGRFGSTQSTVLALKAINAYDAARAVPKEPGSVQLYIDGIAVGKPAAFDTESKGAIALPDFSNRLSAGQHSVELRMTDGSKMPFAIEITYNTRLPANSSVTPLTLTTMLSHEEVTEGEPLEMLATVNVTDDNIPTPIAIIGIPAGLELRHDQLKELVGSNAISAYEIRDSELILYWRALKGGETLQIPVSLTAEIPGTYTGPASRIYPYYTDEQKQWQAGHSITVVSR